MEIVLRSWLETREGSCVRRKVSIEQMRGGAASCIYASIEIFHQDRVSSLCGAKRSSWNLELGSMAAKASNLKLEAL